LSDNCSICKPAAPLLTTHHSPLTTHYSLLTSHYSPLTTHYSPLTISTFLSPLFALNVGKYISSAFAGFSVNLPVYLGIRSIMNS